MEINLWYIVYSEKANQMIFFPKIYGLVSKEQGCISHDVIPKPLLNVRHVMLPSNQSQNKSP